MPQKVLNNRDIHPAHPEVRGEGVAEIVEAKVFDLRLRHGRFKGLPEIVGILAAEMVENIRAFRMLRSRYQNFARGFIERNMSRLSIF